MANKMVEYKLICSMAAIGVESGEIEFNKKISAFLKKVLELHGSPAIGLAMRTPMNVYFNRCQAIVKKDK